jgi:hypothetical protein
MLTADMENIQAKELLDKYKGGKLTEEEWTQLDSWYLHEAQSNEVQAARETMQENIAGLWEKLSPKPVNRSFLLNNWTLWAVAITAVVRA